LRGERGEVYISYMTITLHPSQQKWLEEQVAAGRFASVEDAVALAIAELMEIDGGDLAWAKPYVDEARDAVARGEVVSVEDAVADIDAHLATLKR
jgi:antitoxin ParD1/3/4